MMRNFKLGCLVLVCLTLGMAMPAQADIVTGLALHYELDQTSGTYVPNTGSGFSYMGTPQPPSNADGTILSDYVTFSDTQWTTDCKVGTRALEFRGSDAYSNTEGNIINIPRYTEEAASVGTISMWFKSHNVSRQQWLFSQVHTVGSVTNKIYLYQNADGTVSTRLAVGAAEKTISTSAIQANEWYHLAVTWDGTDMSTYLNNQLVGQEAFSSAINMPGRAAAVGAYYPNGTQQQRKWDGIIDDFRTYNRALTGTQEGGDLHELYTHVPEPSTLVVLGLGTLWASARRRKK